VSDPRDDVAGGAAPEDAPDYGSPSNQRGDPGTGSTAEDPSVERTGPPPDGTDPMGEGAAPSG
jgi:hypothetical protein